MSMWTIIGITFLMPAFPVDYNLHKGRIPSFFFNTTKPVLFHCTKKVLNIQLLTELIRKLLLENYKEYFRALNRPV